jgi:uncharacterized membrane protein YgcG
LWWRWCPRPASWTSECVACGVFRRLCCVLRCLWSAAAVCMLLLPQLARDPTRRAPPLHTHAHHRYHCYLGGPTGVPHGAVDLARVAADTLADGDMVQPAGAMMLNTETGPRVRRLTAVCRRVCLPRQWADGHHCACCLRAELAPAARHTHTHTHTHEHTHTHTQLYVHSLGKITPLPPGEQVRTVETPALPSHIAARVFGLRTPSAGAGAGGSAWGGFGSSAGGGSGGGGGGGGSGGASAAASVPPLNPPGMPAQASSEREAAWISLFQENGKWLDQRATVRDTRAWRAVGAPQHVAAGCAQHASAMPPHACLRAPLCAPPHARHPHRSRASSQTSGGGRGRRPTRQTPGPSTRSGSRTRARRRGCATRCTCCRAAARRQRTQAAQQQPGRRRARGPTRRRRGPTHPVVPAPAG